MPANVTTQERDHWNVIHQLELRVTKVLNVLMMALPFIAAWHLYYAKHVSSPYYFWGNVLVDALFVIFYTVFGRIYSAFLISLNRISELIYSQVLAALISDFFMYIIVWLLTKHLPSVVPMLAIIAAQILMSVIWSFGAHKWYFHYFKPIRTVVVWDMRNGDAMGNMLKQYGLDKRFKVTATPTIKECLKSKEDILAGAQAVMLCGIHSHDRNIIIKYCVEKSIRVYVIPRVGDMIMESARPIHMLHLPMLMVERYNPSPIYLFGKRAFDIVVSVIALVILSPLMLIVAIIIKATDGGTVFYRQCRLTRNRKRFFVLKFRSMRMDAEKDGVARLSTGDKDDRITPIGHFIRACRIDELPQLINILKGEMSIVGPRPERPEIAREYERVMPEFSLRLQAKAGLTGYAQVFGKYNTTPYDKLLMDLQYIAKPSFATDLKIMFATVKILFMPESTEGVATGQTTAADSENKTSRTEKWENGANLGQIEQKMG